MKFFIFGFLVLVLAARGAHFAATKSAQCRTNAHCPDSGTVCSRVLDPNSKFTLESEPQTTSKAPAADSTNDAYDPLADDDVNLIADDDISNEFADAEILDDANAVVGKTTDDPKKVVLKKGVKVIPAKSDAEKGEITVSSRLLINGWNCVVTAVSQPRGSKIQGTSVSADVLAEFDGSTPTSAADDVVEAAGKLAIGKIVRVGPVSCKITGPLKKSGPDGTTKAPTATKPASAATKPASAATNPATTKKVTLTTTIKPTSGLGQCLCDPEKRFACTTDDDCMTRFREKNVLCFPTSLCSTEIGPGYCRRKSQSTLEDEGEQPV